MPKSGGSGGSTGTIKGNRNDNVLDGTDQSEVIQGLGGNDVLNGLGGDDTLQGGDGDDTLDGGAGSDLIDGGAGTDTALFDGLWSDYTITLIDATTVAITAPDGSTDTVSNVEVFTFADVTLAFGDLIPPDDPNLSASGLSVDAASLAPGETATATWTIASDGFGDANASTTRIVIATAPDTASIIGEAATQSVTALATGSSTQVQAVLDLSALAPGTYYIAAEADSGGVLAETDEGDNLSGWVQITIEPPVPNLSAGGLTLDDVSLAPGEVATLDVTISSDGTGDAGATEAAVLLATAPDLGSVIAVLDTQTVAALATGMSTGLTATLDLSGFAPGTYYVAVQADSGDALAETNEGDNVSNWVAVVVEVPVPNLAASGLVIADASVAPDELTALEFTLTSDGTGDAGATQATVLVATAPDAAAVIGTAGSTAIGALATGSTTQVQATADLNGFAPGTYYVAVQADSGDVLAETNEADNISNWIMVTVEEPAVDFAVSNFAVDPASDFDLGGGATVLLGYDLTNAGNVSGSYQIDVYLSVDGVLSADDILLGQDFGYSDPGTSIAGAMTLSIDAGESAGDYQIITVATWQGAYPDPDLSDNTTSIGVTLLGGTVMGTPGDDLVYGDAGSTTFDLGDGNDTVIGSGGSDTVLGGAGVDTVDYSGLSAAISVQWDVNGDNLTAVKADGEDILDGVEVLIGTAYDDVVYEMSYYEALGSLVELYGGDGNDALILETNRDVTLDGGAGDDMLAGLWGNDVLTGGSGADTFYFFRSVEVDGVYDDYGDDVITDFNAAEDLLAVQLDGPAAGYDPFDYLTQTAEGVVFSDLGNGTVLLAGVDLADLTMANFNIFEPAVWSY